MLRRLSGDLLESPDGRTRPMLRPPIPNLQSASCNDYDSVVRRFLRSAFALILALVVIVAAAGYLYLRRSLPTLDGEIAVAGLAGPVDIVRDRDAIPHIFAATKMDAFFGLGYVHAQDRLWQMEFQRRVGRGRLSEIFGPSTIPQDRFLRTVGFGRAAAAAWKTTPDWARQQIDAYVAGINAFIATHHGSRLPPEFTLLRFEPEPWSGEDVAVWVKMMAWDLSKNFYAELMRHDLLAAVGPERLADLMPPYPPGGLSILSERDIADVVRTASRSGDLRHMASRVAAGVAQNVRPAESGSWSSAFRAGLSGGEPAVTDLLFGGATSDAIGSNSWVVDGTMTASGKPMLANDPHLDLQIPSIWYLAHLSAGDFDVIGATLPGTPAVAIGCNRFIAWGETNGTEDVEDFYEEHLDPSGRFAEFRGAQEPLTTRAETIAVKGAASIHVEVRSTRHGPLVSDAINANNAALPADRRPPPLEPLALRWTALDDNDSTLSAFLKLNEAKNWTEFTGALRDYVVPAQNVVYADVDGHIGYYVPGRVPIRASGDGRVPADGWSGAMEWTGWIPFEELPHAFDPPEHFIVTANNRPVPAEYPHVLGFEWSEPFRAGRITGLIGSVRGARSKLTLDDFSMIQADTFSSHADALLPTLLLRVHPKDTADSQALAIVRNWDRDARADSAGSAIFQAWLLHLTPALVADKIGPVLMADYRTFERLSVVSRFLANTLKFPESTSGTSSTASTSSMWCDDTTTPARETCEDAVSKALHEAVTDLSQQLGADPSRWRWDGVHRAMFRHQLDSVRVLRPFLSRSVPSGGDWSTVNVGPVTAAAPYEQRAAPGYRQIVDLSPANDSRFIDAVGESGHFLSKHYDDFMQDWRALRYRKMRTNRAEIDAGATGHLRLTPR